jgi:tripartite-type tricarboxylate transporter receptor subunit TctC
VNSQLLQPHLEKALGVGVMIINKPGGGGTIAWNFVAHSPPDGYTVAHINPSLIITQYTTKTGVDYRKFDPIIYTVGIPAGVVVRFDSPWKTFKEFLDDARANPRKIQMANSGHGAMYHIGIMGIEMATGVKFTHVPYKGSGPCVTALLGGHADGSLIEISTLLPHVEAGKLRVLAVSSPERNFALPAVPSFKEFGFDLDVGTWYAYVVPKGTPQERTQILHGAFKKAVETEEFKSPYKKQGGVVQYMGPAELAAFLNNQDRLWKKIMDFSGFKPID